MINITIEDFDNLTREVRALKILTLNLRDIIEDGIYSNDIHNDAIQERHIEDGIITKNKITLTLDDIKDGFVYGRLLGTSIEAGEMLLSEATGSLDDLADGTYGKLLSTSLSEGLALLSACDGTLDDITNGTNYGRVKVTNISSGKILLAECTGNLDNIANGTDFGKIALTSISSGKIIVAGLDSGITDRMFANLNTKNAIEAWRHTSDVTMIDGGDIYANSLTLVGTANDFNYSSLGGTKPPTDADKTSTHTAADTSKVNGVTSSIISGWRYGSTTYINGGNIYTGTVTANEIAANTITADKYNELRNTYVFNGDDSLDASFPFELDFEIVSEMTTIDSIKLSFRISQFRAYSTGIPSGGGSTSGSGGGQTSSTNTSGSTNLFVFTEANYVTHVGQESKNGYLGSAYDTLSLAAKAHTHSVDDHTHTVPNHTHSLNFGIYEDSQSPTIHYYIDNGSGYGSASGAFTTDQLDINITGSISGTGFKRIKFVSDKRCRIRAWVMCKVDISA